MKPAFLLIRSRRVTRTALATCMALLATTTTLFVAAGPAQAGLVNINCVGEQVVNYAPGVTLQPQVVDFVGRADFDCVSLTDPTITSGSYGAAGTATLQCTVGPTTGQSVYVWNTGDTSTVSWTTTVPLRPAGVTALVFEGTVIAGKFPGADLNGTLTLVPTAGNCLSGGITEVRGPLTIVLTDG